ncbi:MAG: dienelactone hydrolase family protein [Tildeniella nuda ZEHNDER 1965/U140]|jgi:carboxymethylenebutenolidase|nr:dienelactone hydrolase family protein [Tildeniella nuda ZEHNDER 1965/U140]
MPEFTRRRFMVTAAFAGGFALAVQPIAASVINTSAEGIIAGAVKIPTKDVPSIPAYRAMPAKGTNFPIVLVLHEIFGVHAHIEDVCRRFAKLGYVAIAPQLFTRQGDVLKLSSVDEIRPIVAKVPDAQVMSDLDATVAWAVSDSKGNAAKLTTTGFCWGGRIVWLYAAHNPNVKAGVAWYGRLVGDANALMPKYPVDVASTLKVPVLGLYGGKDTGIPLTTVEQMRDRLKSGSSKSEIVVYPDASHAFFADYRPSYREADAKDGWKKLQAWFKQQGV